MIRDTDILPKSTSGRSAQNLMGMVTSKYNILRFWVFNFLDINKKLLVL